MFKRSCLFSLLWTLLVKKVWKDEKIEVNFFFIFIFLIVELHMHLVNPQPHPLQYFSREGGVIWFRAH